MIGHKCQEPQLLLLENYMNLQGDQCEEKEDRAEGEQEHNTFYNLEISLHALIGWSTPRTMRMKAHIGN